MSASFARFVVLNTSLHTRTWQAMPLHKFSVRNAASRCGFQSNICKTKSPPSNCVEAGEKCSGCCFIKNLQQRVLDLLGESPSNQNYFLDLPQAAVLLELLLLEMLSLEPVRKDAANRSARWRCWIDL